MKAYIGPYKNFFGPYQLAQAILFWIPKKKDEYGCYNIDDRVYRFGEWLAHGSIIQTESKEVGDVFDLRENRNNTWLYKFLLWVDEKRERKVKVRIDRYDTWSMDHTLAYIILPMLKQMKENKHGAPYIDDEDVPEHLRSTSAPTLTEDDKSVGNVDENHFLRWEYALDEMIFAFETKAGVLQDWEDQFTTGEYDFRFKKISEDGTCQLIHSDNHTAETDWEGRKAYQNRISNGFRLFGKYYEALWT
jgi:hypothetical protein